MLFFFRSTHRKALIPLLIGIVLLGVAFFVARQKPESPLATATPSGSPQNSAIPSVNVSGWRLYSSQNVGFRMKYDPTLTVDQTQADSIRFSMWGPTQRGQTELYDGISLEVRRVAANSFDDYVNQQMDQFKDAGGITIPLHTVTLNGINGKSFSGSGLGEATEILIPVDDSHLIQISYFAPDPGQLGFEQIIQAMLATLELI